MEIEYKGYIGQYGFRNMYIFDIEGNYLEQSYCSDEPTEQDMKEMIDNYILHKALNETRFS